MLEVGAIRRIYSGWVAVQIPETIIEAAKAGNVQHCNITRLGSFNTGTSGNVPTEAPRPGDFRR